MDERIPCEFSLIRYVPDVVKGEYVNIGVVLRGVSIPKAPSVRFTRDWSRVRCVDPDADTDMLEALEYEMAELLARETVGPAPSRPLIPLLSDTLSNSIQITEPRACLAETIALELEQLMRRFVDPLREKVARRRTGRSVIFSAMRNEFERVGAWKFMRRQVAASLYTGQGDPLKLDCGYRPNVVVRIFHAVSLDSDIDAAKSLAYSAPMLHEGVARVEGGSLELTAVVEPIRAVSNETGSDNDFTDEAAEHYRFAVRSMEREKIRVITVSDLARAAETARMELGL